MISVIAIGVKGVQIIFAAIVLGLSISLAKHQVLGNVPSETGFSAFAGAFGILTGAIGLAALFISKIPNMVPVIADALSTIFFLAGGIALTLAMKGVSSCTSDSNSAFSDRFDNKILNGGCVHGKGDDDVTLCFTGGRDSEPTKGRCQKARADFVFEFIAFLFGVAAIALGFLLWRRNRKTTGFA